MNFINKKYTLERYKVKEKGAFPNNDLLNVLLYKNVFNLPYFFAANKIKSLFRKNGWTNAWKNGIYTFHHYHSVTHEVMGVYKGKTTLMFGGENGTKVTIEKGDVLIIPVGVAHKNLGAQNQIKCVGAYPGGKDFDMNYGKPDERPQADENIRKVPVPAKDPIFGLNGELHYYWK
jgi:uncharacterized protein YjlB